MALSISLITPLRARSCSDSKFVVVAGEESPSSVSPSSTSRSSMINNLFKYCCVELVLILASVSLESDEPDATSRSTSLAETVIGTTFLEDNSFSSDDAFISQEMKSSE